MKKLLILFLLGLFSQTGVAQTAPVEYEIRYNPVTGLYEARAHVLSGDLNSGPAVFRIQAPSKFTAVFPASVSNTIITPNSVEAPGSVWSNTGTNVYAPTITPNLDYRLFSTGGGGTFTTFTAGDDILLFTFSLAEGCVDGIRVFNNDTDPNSAQPGMGGADLTNVLQTTPSRDQYSGNRNEDFFFVQTSPGNWDNASTWLNGRIPTPYSNVRIDHSGVSTILASDQDYVVDNIITAVGSELVIENGRTLGVTKDVTNGGDFTGEGLVELVGVCGAQSIFGDSVDDADDPRGFSNLRIANADGVTMLDDHDITGVLDIDAGDFSVSTGEFFTFRSTPTTTAVVDEVAAGSSVTGCFVIERYIPGNRDFRYLGSPVNTATAGCGFKPTINDNLQEGEQVTNRFNYTTATDSSGTPVGNTTYGTHITGFATQTLSDVATDGLDATQTGDPSMFTYDNPGQAWNGVFNTDATNLFVGTPFALMVRGGRDMDLNVSNFQVGNETILRFTGEIVTGTYTAPNLSTAAGAFNFVANPYQAQVNLGTLLLSDSAGIVNNQAIVYDPVEGAAFGGYTTLEFDVNGAVATKVPSTSDANVFLQPNQSFFVQNAAAPASVGITFRESYKSNNTLTTAVFSQNTATDLVVAIDVYNTDENILRDGVHVRVGNTFNNNIVSGEDAYKFFNNEETFSTLHNGSYLAIDKRAPSNTQEDVQLFMYNFTDHNYQLKMFVENPDNKAVYLVDNYLGTSTLLDSNYLEYNFSVDTNVPNSADTNRFVLNFTNTTLGSEDFEFSGISLYPNPVKDSLEINLANFTGEVRSIAIYDMMGRLVSKLAEANDTNISVNMSAYASGMYMVEIDTNKGNYVEKVIKE